MMTIRPAQMDALEDDARRRFLARVVERVGGALPPQAGAPWDQPDSLRLAVLAATDRAAAYGMDDEASLVAFALMSLAQGLGFEEGPDHGVALAILQDADTPGNAKMLLLRGIA